MSNVSYMEKLLDGAEVDWNAVDKDEHLSAMQRIWLDLILKAERELYT